MYQVTSQEMIRLRRRLLATDPVFALHDQVRQFFLTPSPEFGILASDPEWDALAFFSTKPGAAFIHYYDGNLGRLGEFREFFGTPCQLFLRHPLKPEDQRWTPVLEVTPGMIVDHPAYSGVFSRVAPRFYGTVFEHD